MVVGCLVTCSLLLVYYASLSSFVVVIFVFVVVAFPQSLVLSFLVKLNVFATLVQSQRFK